MKNQIRSAFDEIKAGQELKKETKYFLYDFYNKKETTQPRSMKKLILAPLAAVLAVVLTFGIFTTAVPVSAVSFDVENTSVELELNSLNRVLKVNCFGDTEGFSELNLKSLDCESAVALIVEKAKKENADISSAVLTVNCKSDEKAEALAGTITEGSNTDLNVSCHSYHGKLREQAHSHGISTGKYQAYLTLKQYEPDLSIDDARELSMSELKRKINSYTSGEPEDDTDLHPHKTEHHSNRASGNGRHHEKNK